MIYATPHGVAAFDLHHADAATRFMSETGAVLWCRAAYPRILEPTE